MFASPTSVEGVASNATGLLGAQIVVRVFGTALEYPVPNWSPPTGGGWREYHGGWKGLWCLDAFANHVVVQRPDRVVVAQISTGKPEVESAEELGRLALGRQAVPADYGAFPLGIRIPMSPVGLASLVRQGRDFRCERLVPPEEEAPRIVGVGAGEAELRIAATQVNDSLQFFGEAFLCGAHETSDLGDGRRVRHSFFPHDAAKVLSLPPDSQSVISEAVQKLFLFCCSAGQIDQGRRLPGCELGRVGRRFGRLGVRVALPPDVGVGPHWVDLELPDSAGAAAVASEAPSEKKYPALLLEAAMHYGGTGKGGHGR